jgi:hypothetical protein
MPGLVPGIHVLASAAKKDVDDRDKPGHDEKHYRALPGPHCFSMPAFLISFSHSTS